MSKTHQPALGLGAFSVPDIALILRLPQGKVRRMLNQVWDERLGKALFGDTFSITIGDQKFVNFHVMIELFVYFELREIGASAQRILKARNAMRTHMGTEHPFATATLLSHGKKIWYEYLGDVIDADGTRQSNFVDMVRDYAKNIDFNADKIAERYWPMGRHHQVVVDPLHQFGMPTIAGTNINTHTLRSMFRSGETPEVLSGLFNLPLSSVQDAINFHGRELAAKAA
ncbi:MAG: DUF433 domain-containing protein [Flavobacteriales bacterium]|nr:DUF433 domain-containing protein [Flavobacteriales bacterium]